MPPRSATIAKKRVASSLKGEPDKRVSREENLLQQLEEEILLGNLPPGSRLDEKQLADRFHVSRTPVREALWHLASSGLVETRRHHGAIVKQLTLVELIEMFQVMAELEGLCARLAARRMTLAERKQLHQIHRLAGKRIGDQDFEAFFESNNEFHKTFSSAARTASFSRKAVHCATALIPIAATSRTSPAVWASHTPSMKRSSRPSTVAMRTKRKS
jgi:DNA-binding GntR family transcriptional regulator